MWQGTVSRRCTCEKSKHSAKSKHSTNEDSAIEGARYEAEAEAHWLYDDNVHEIAWLR